MTTVNRSIRTTALTFVAGASALIFFVVPGYLTPGVEAQSAPRYVFDPAWPKTLPNKWKMGGVTGLAVDKDDTSGSSIARTTHSTSKATPVSLHPWPTAACGRRR